VKSRYNVALISLLSTSLYSYEFIPIGFKSIAMGGSGVATASSSQASYYNPALLAKTPNERALSFTFGVGFNEQNLTENMDGLNDTFKMSETLQSVKDSANSGVFISDSLINNLTNIQSIVTNLSQHSSSLQITPTQSLSTKINRFGIGLFSSANILATAKVEQKSMNGDSVSSSDFENIVVENSGKYYAIDLINQTYNQATQTEYENSFVSSFQESKSSNKLLVSIEGLNIIEVPISYAKSYHIKDGGYISFGASLKYMYGLYYLDSIQIDSESGDIENSVDTTPEVKSSNIGIDFGTIYTPKSSKNLTLGAVVKNINSPKFDTNSKDIRVEPMIRAGLNYRYSKNLEFAMDLDITKNYVVNRDEESQYIGAGLNYTLFRWIDLRAGIMKNIASNTQSLIYTAGLSIGSQYLSLDIASEVSSESTKYDGNSIPSYAKLNFALTSRW
jgi:hypothetical protein